MATQTATESKPKEGLTLDKAREIYSRTKAPGGKIDISHIYKYYHPNMVFRDSIQVVKGRAPFIEMSERLVSRCDELLMEVHNAAQTGNVIFVEWTMSMRFQKTPFTPLHGTTRLTLDEDGLILEHRDYFDLWGDSFDAVPGFGKLYRRVMHRLFG